MVSHHSVVEDEWFQRLVPFLGPRHVLPGRQYFTDVRLLQLFQTVRTHIEPFSRQHHTHLFFTSDIWSSSACPMTMLSLTIHFIDQNSQHNVVLHRQEFTGSHTAEALAAPFRDMF